MPFHLQRSYRKELFDTCVSILRKNAIKSEETIVQFRDFALRVSEAAVVSMKEDLSYGEIPDEFKGQRLECTSNYVPSFQLQGQGC